ncbi:MAG: anaerobic glycerol-3-phosphate dehydrogenase subunit GlpA [Desulfobacterales bacterium]
METRVLIIGGGVTGVGLARDLSLRGIECTLVEARDINAGASGANHGLLHSGARYVRNDPESAVECREENQILRRIAPHCIEETGGLFVAVAGDDERYAADFPHFCRRAGIDCRELAPAEARSLEPLLSERLIAAYAVDDAAIDPFRLALDNLGEAMERGCRVLLSCRVEGFEVEGKRISAARLLDPTTGERRRIAAQVVVNAAGAWAKEVAALAGVPLSMTWSKGSLLITDRRLAHRVLNRLRPASDADILVPGGTVSILGTSSVRLDSLEEITPSVAEIDDILEAACDMVPALAATRFIRAYAGVRPLVGGGEGAGDRLLRRGFALFDHEAEGLDNFITITGGKLTTYRRMAEKAADLACRKLGVHTPGRTAETPLAPQAANRWVEAGAGPRCWLEACRAAGERLLCECEMIHASAVDEVCEAIRRQGGRPSLYGIGRRSRVGKGTCQGAFCGIRVNAHLYDRGVLRGRAGIADLRTFLGARWRGMRPILWGTALAQEELQEALHCGLFSLDLEKAP